MANILFVYGTLRQGEYNHYLLEGAVYKGLVEIDGRLATITQGFPQYKSTGVGVVTGELYEVSKEKLLELDELEIPYGYARVTANWVDKFGRSGECEVYEYVRSIEHATQIPGGDWVEWRDQNARSRW